MALAVTTLLAMSTTTSSINNSLPPVAYTKAIDVWTNLCVTFVFLALLEYALVNYAARYYLTQCGNFRNFLPLNFYVKWAKNLFDFHTVIVMMNYTDNSLNATKETETENAIKEVFRILKYCLSKIKKLKK